MCGDQHRSDIKRAAAFFITHLSIFRLISLCLYIFPTHLSIFSLISGVPYKQISQWTDHDLGCRLALILGYKRLAGTKIETRPIYDPVFNKCSHGDSLQSNQRDEGSPGRVQNPILRRTFGADAVRKNDDVSFDCL